jgi:hypothetical protein
MTLIEKLKVEDNIKLVENNRIDESAVLCYLLN